MHVRFRHAFAFSELQERVEMGNMAVHPAVGQQPVKMQFSAARLCAAHGREQGFILKKCPVLDFLRDAGQLLIDDPARADVQMPHFGVAHLPVRQADVSARGAELRMGIFLPELFNIRAALDGDGVALPIGIDPVSVHNQNTIRSRHNPSSCPKKSGSILPLPVN